MSYNTSAISWKFFAAGGPGGQHVNKVATAAMLRVQVNELDLPEHVTIRLSKLGKASLEGIITITARRFKSQEQNKEDALARFHTLLEKARHIPTPRRKTRPTRASGERRILAKKTRSTIKQGRGKVVL